jgi:type III restriction enzyme
MSKSVIAYDKDLPEIPGRRPWEKPTSYLVKDDSAPNGWRVNESGRRPSKLLLVPRLREQVDNWRKGSYEGASEVTRRLFTYWFEEDHEVPGFGMPFRYYFCQREAIETLAWLVEINQQRDVQKLIETHATIFEKDLFNKNITFQTLSLIHI